MERKGLVGAFSRMTNSFRACMVDEYLKSYLAHSKANAVIVMEAENRELALCMSSMEVQRDGIFLRFSESGREDLVRHLNVVTDTYDGLSERESFEGVCSSTVPSVSSADVSIEMVDMTRSVPDSAEVRAEDIFEPRPREMRAPCPEREVTASLETPSGSPGGDLGEQVDLSYMSAADILKNAAGVMAGACDPLINGVTAESSRRRHGRSASMSAARGRVPGDIPWPPAGRAGAGGMSELRRQRGGDIGTMFDMEEDIFNV